MQFEPNLKAEDQGAVIQLPNILQPPQRYRRLVGISDLPQ
jgi:hypothetical protein